MWAWENVPSSRSPSETEDNELEQEELRDHSLRQNYRSELVDNVDGAEAASDREQDEENLSEEDD